ncbi:hypothetical protein AMATHDRAFT_76956 [Amanita thiersii Skay4041]|uniref:Enoyl-CoA hydratase n=1 Tax=Amanita thiersii Skay4041 TaxID=703135 RepID=A0A2A9NJK3_9AGAR|nr:hypothetical protein AMATHDRAFT_76956 [Amanita thiersii Skay4041]
MSLPDYAALGFTDILVTLDDPIATVLINRAKHYNTFSDKLCTECIQVFDLFDKDDRVRVVILTADPTAPVFCAGADITSGWDRLCHPDASTEGHQVHRDPGGQLTLAIYKCRKITIAAVNGHAAGVGMTALQLPFDLRFVWEGARLTFPFVRRGINPEAASTYLLPRLLGHSRAASLLLTGSTFPATSPIISALYHQLLPIRDQVYPAAKALAHELASTTSQAAIAYTKSLLQHPGKSVEENHLLDSHVFSILVHQSDPKEGALAFREKRAPRFKDTLSTISVPWTSWWRKLDLKHAKSRL